MNTKTFQLPLLPDLLELNSYQAIARELRIAITLLEDTKPAKTSDEAYAAFRLGVLTTVKS